MNEATNTGAAETATERVYRDATDRVYRDLAARFPPWDGGVAILATEGVAAYLAWAAGAEAAMCVEFTESLADLDRAFCEAIAKADAAGWGGPTATGADWTATGAEVAAAHEASGETHGFLALAVLMAYRRGFAVNRETADAEEAEQTAKNLDNLATAAAACRLLLAIDTAATRGKACRVFDTIDEAEHAAEDEAALLAVCEQWIANDPGAARLLSKGPTA